RNLEQHLVRALLLCGDQLHRELGLCRVRRAGIVDRRLSHHHLPAPPARRPAGGSRGGVKKAWPFRHCEERQRRSNPALRPRARKLDCFAPLAMTWIDMRSHSHGSVSPELCNLGGPRSDRGRRESRALDAPVECPRAFAHGVETTGTTETSRLS